MVGVLLGARQVVLKALQAFRTEIYRCLQVKLSIQGLYPLLLCCTNFGFVLLCQTNSSSKRDACMSSSGFGNTPDTYFYNLMAVTYDQQRGVSDLSVCRCIEGPIFTQNRLILADTLQR